MTKTQKSTNKVRCLLLASFRLSCLRLTHDINTQIQVPAMEQSDNEGAGENSDQTDFVPAIEVRHKVVYLCCSFTHHHQGPTPWHQTIWQLWGRNVVWRWCWSAEMGFWRLWCLWPRGWRLCHQRGRGVWIRKPWACNLQETSQQERGKLLWPSSLICSPVIIVLKPRWGELRQTINNARQVTPASGVIISTKRKDPADSKSLWVSGWTIPLMRRHSFVPQYPTWQESQEDRADGVDG